MSQDATVEESAMLVNRLTGEQREVDVAIRAVTGGHVVIVSVEARASSRRADAPWVESMLGKHANLATDKLVLVSQTGFTRQARALAEANGAVALEPQDLTGEDPSWSIVNRLRSLWPKFVSLNPERAQVTVSRPEGEKWFRAPHDLNLYLEDGSYITTLIEWFQGATRLSWDKIIEDIGLRDIAESMDRFFSLEMGNPVLGQSGTRLPIFARDEDAEGGPEFHRVVRIRFVGQAHIEVAEFELSHHRLGDVAFAQGSSSIGGRPALLVATENDEGGQLSIRFGESEAGTKEDPNDAD
jgi:hypothetical protein